LTAFGYIPDFKNSNPLLDKLLKVFGLPILPRRIQARSVLKILAHNSNANLLDAGCGDGIFSIELARRGYGVVVGMDVDRGKIALANRRVRSMNLNDKVELLVGDVQHAPFTADSFDRVLCNCVLEHVPDDSKALAELVRVLRTGGILVVTAPSETPRIVIPIGKLWIKSPRSIRKALAPPFLSQPRDPKSFEEEFWKFKQRTFREIRNYSLDDLSEKLQAIGLQLLRSEYNLKLFGAAMWNLIIGLRPIHLNRGMALAFPFMYAFSLMDEFFPSNMKGEEFAASFRKL